MIADILMALDGVVIAMLPPDYGLAGLKTNLLQHGGPYSCALACIVS